MTLTEMVARAIYDAMEGPVANQDAARQMRQWETAQGLSAAVFAALRDPPPEVIEAGARGAYDAEWGHGSFDSAATSESEKEIARGIFLASWRAALNAKE